MASIASGKGPVRALVRRQAGHPLQLVAPADIGHRRACPVWSQPFKNGVESHSHSAQQCVEVSRLSAGDRTRRSRGTD